MEENVLVFNRYHLNPLITPRLGKKWEEKGTLNLGGAFEENVFHLFYRAVGIDNISSLGYAAVTRDMRIIERPDHPIFVPNQEWERLGCEDPRISRIDDIHYLLYTAYSPIGPRVAVASSSELRQFRRLSIIGPDLPDKDAVLFPELIDGKLAMVHRIEPSMQIAYFESGDFEKFANLEVRSQYWKEYLSDPDAHVLMKPVEWWKERRIGAGPPPLKTSEDWLIIYHGVDDSLVYRAGLALADLEKPWKISARSRTPILEPEESYEMDGFVRRAVFPEAAMIVDEILYLFYGAADSVCCVATATVDEVVQSLTSQQ